MLRSSSVSHELPPVGDRIAARPIKDQIERVSAASSTYNYGVVYARASVDDALLRAVEHNSPPVHKVKLTDEKWAAAYENLSMLIESERISYPNDPDLVAELDVLKSEFTSSGAPDYSLQREQDAEARSCAR